MRRNVKTGVLWDVVVIGGGPAGMIAAGRAAELGRSVLLFEKNSTLGKKLLITGGGRCNLTNNKPDVRTMLAKYKDSGKFLFSAFSQFGVEETVQFFNKLGLYTKEEAEGRIFPVSNKAQSVLDVLVTYMKNSGANIQTNTAVTNLSHNKIGDIIIIRFKDISGNDKEIFAHSCIVATGGVSRPETGSNGDGFVWLKKNGHKIIADDLALVPITLQDSWVKKLGGVSLKDIKLTVMQNGQRHEVQKGKLLFTHVGISGPTILNMSKGIGELLQYGKVIIELDLFPNLDQGELKQKLQKLLMVENNKKLKNILNKLIPAALVSSLLELVQLDGDTSSHSVRHEDRIKLVKLFKAIPLNVKGLLGANKAIVSSGGVALEEIDFKTMQSRLVKNLYIIGDALNIDRPSGGYSLQLAWTTGYVAGSNS